MNYTSDKKFNKIQHGLISGVVLPLIVVIMFYIIRYSQNTDFSKFLTILKTYDITEKIIALCVMPNLLLFFIFMWTDRNQAARGVIMATMIYTIIVLIMKYI